MGGRIISRRDDVCMLYSVWWELLGKFISLEIKEGVLVSAYLSGIADGKLEATGNRDKEVIDKVIRYIFGEEFSLNEIEVDISRLTHFQQQVMMAMRRIPPGETISYSALALDAGYPNAARAVGSVCARNPILLIIPCHRIVRKDGIGNFGYGSDIKKKMIQHENDHFG